MNDPTGTRNTKPGKRSTKTSQNSSTKTSTKTSTKPPNPRRALGIAGEERAADHLVRRGYRIVDRNVRAGGVEIDLVARRGTLVVFVEVKTRRSKRFGPPELAVDADKRARLVRGAVAWLQTNRRRAGRVRFDVIAWQVSGDPSAPDTTWHVHHLEGAFDAGD